MSKMRFLNLGGGGGLLGSLYSGGVLLLDVYGIRPGFNQGSLTHKPQTPESS